MRNQKSEKRKLFVKHSPLIVISLCLCPLRAETKHPCGDYYLTQRAQRAQSFNFHTIHAVAGDVASFTTTGERRDKVTNEYSKQLLVSASLCALLSRVASDPSNASVI